MSPDKDNQSVFDEPHLRPDRPRADQSGNKADQTPRREGASASDAADGHSVFDEPDVFPGRADEVVEQDWSCTNCGYNLRGLPTHHPCPECGHKELYRPAPPGSASYQNWLRRRIEATSPTRAWTVALLLAACGGPWAILAAMLDVGSAASGGLLLLMVVLAPVVEETMKIAAAAWVVEVRPYLFRRVEQLQVATVGSALVFAAIENVLYLNVYNPNPTLLYTIWRWTVCVALHMGCTLLATRGLAEVWRRCTTELRPPRLTQGLRWLVIAIIIHACYNAAAVAWSWIQ